MIECKDCRYSNNCPCGYSAHNAACLAIARPKQEKLDATDILEDLFTARNVLCVPDMLTDYMRIKISQVITNAIDYIDSHKPHELTKEEWEAWKKNIKRDPICIVWKNDYTPCWIFKPENIHEPAYLMGEIKLFSGKPDRSMINWEKEELK